MDSATASATSCAMPTADESSHSATGTLHPHHNARFNLYTVSQKNVLTLKRYSSKLQAAILMKFGRNIQNTLE